MSSTCIMQNSTQAKGLPDLRELSMTEQLNLARTRAFTTAIAKLHFRRGNDSSSRVSATKPGGHFLHSFWRRKTCHCFKMGLVSIMKDFLVSHSLKSMRHRQRRQKYHSLSASLHRLQLPFYPHHAILDSSMSYQHHLLNYPPTQHLTAQFPSSTPPHQPLHYSPQ